MFICTYVESCNCDLGCGYNEIMSTKLLFTQSDGATQLVYVAQHTYSKYNYSSPSTNHFTFRGAVLAHTSVAFA